MSITLASIPSSREKPRPSTRVAVTSQVSVSTGSNTLVVAANLNRTDLTIRNTDSANPVYYDYFDNPDMLTKGFLLKAGEALPYDSPQDVYMQATGASVTVAVDEGSG